MRTTPLVHGLVVFCIFAWTQPVYALYREGSVNLGAAQEGGFDLDSTQQFGGDPGALVVPFAIVQIPNMNDYCLTWGYDDRKTFGGWEVRYHDNYDPLAILEVSVSDPNVKECADGLVVLPPQPAVIPANDNFMGQSGQQISGNVTINDSGWDPQYMIVDVQTGPNHGTLDLDVATGLFNYAPNPGFAGTDTFTYCLFVDGGCSSSATVTFTINSANRPPIAVNDAFAGDYVGKNVLVNDTDPDNDPLTAILESQPRNGTVNLNANGTFVYTPNSGFSGADSFTYRASDGQEVSASAATVSLTVISQNAPPVAVDDPFGTNYAGKNVLANDSDPDGDALIAIKVSDPSNGKLMLNSDGTFEYTPFSGVTGEDSFTYKAQDQDGLESNIATVTLGVTGNSDGGAVTDKVDEDGYSVIDNATPEQIEVGNQIDVICPKLAQGGTTTEGQADLLNLCTNLRKQGTTARQTVTALAAITPEEVASQRTIGREASQTQFKNIAGRIAGVRRGAKGVSIAGLNLSHEGVSVPANSLDTALEETLDALGGGASGDEANDFGNLGIFVRGDLSFGDKDETEKESAYNFDAQGLTLGADYRFTSNFFAGISASIGQSKVDFDSNGGDINTDAYAVALYGSVYSEGSAYLDGIVSYGWSDIDSKRNIVYQDFNGKVDREAKGSTDGDQYFIGLSAGYTFNSGRWTIDPSVSFYYLHGEIDPYQEQGAGGWDLAYDDQKYDSMTMALSGQVGYTITTDWGVLIPYARVEYTREFEDDADGIVYGFVNSPFVDDDGADTLQIFGDDLDSNYMIYSAGVSSQFQYGFSGFVSYSLLGSYKNLSSETVSFGLRWETTF